ncbi:ArgS-related anticodon-binding protein NrtL [Streptomyces sp. FIT100]|uniref:ArgS-related anticodon-binding protein NrtL n=1 Tax=Streptomyces sp. FIT100 TaxID=2837956 RepID=UPI0021C6AD5B|nr:DALR anticodon-binding domain-containing protein [Streptomyces sp. FIT100]UUN29195.1 arginine--tRNA ligase [Streptomyces sp. FIT100]
MTPADLTCTVLGAVRRAVEEGALGGAVAVPDRVKVERPRPGGSGDYATNAALRLAREARLPAREVAEVLSAELTRHPGIAGVEITGPGFLNITLARGSRDALVRDTLTNILTSGSGYGHGRALSGQVIELRHRAEVRAAVTADAVRRLLEAQGALVRIDAYGDEAAGPAPTPTPAAGPTSTVAYEPSPVPAGATAHELDRRFGTDATRWALLRAAAHDRPRLDDGLLVQKESNPFFLVRYAHARSRALVRAATRLGITAGYEEDAAALGDHPALLDVLGDHPAVLASAARLRAPDRVARHLETTADAFLGFQHTVLPVGDEKPSAAHRSRLALAEAAGTVLAGGLSLLGISAPEYL